MSLILGCLGVLYDDSFARILCLPYFCNLHCGFQQKKYLSHLTADFLPHGVEVEGAYFITCMQTVRMVNDSSSYIKASTQIHMYSHMELALAELSYLIYIKFIITHISSSSLFISLK